jgi:hypothetical protein
MTRCRRARCRIGIAQLLIGQIKQIDRGAVGSGAGGASPLAKVNVI